MKKFSEKLKKWGNFILSNLLGLIFIAQFEEILYGPPELLPKRARYKEILLRFLPWIGGVFLFLGVAFLLGLIWYHKRSGKKRWSIIITWVLVITFVLLFVLLLSALVFLF